MTGNSLDFFGHKFKKIYVCMFILNKCQCGCKKEYKLKFIFKAPLTSPQNGCVSEVSRAKKKYRSERFASYPSQGLTNGSLHFPFHVGDSDAAERPWKPFSLSKQPKNLQVGPLICQ